MRLDKYLKVTRLIKRRTVAKEACDAGRVIVNDQVAKSGTKVSEGDIIKIRFGDQVVAIEVLQVKEHVKKEEVGQMYRHLS
ncbi:MAG: RNA-binding S4 domain-containing protein [Epulopiscium sp.]|nr:RNA-binding S4 domain-containing protein [Candidatus Epulonipiscium sp.]